MLTFNLRYKFLWVFVFALLLILQSCAILFNSKKKRVRIDADQTKTLVAIYPDTTKWLQTPVSIKVKRAKKDLIILVKKDTTIRQISIKPKLSNTYLIGNYFTIMYSGYLIDLLSNKRFTYPSYLRIPPTSIKTKYNRGYETWRVPTKGMITVKLAIPESNHFYHKQRYNEYGSSFGFLGISGGVEYYLNNKFSMNMDIGSLTNFISPFPTPVRYEGSYSRAFANYIDFQLGKRIKRFQVDAGVQFTRTSYFERQTIDLGFNRFVDSFYRVQGQNCIGLAFSSYYKINNTFNIGLNYYPSFVTWQQSNIQYRYGHLLFLELLFTIEAYNPKRRREH